MALVGRWWQFRALSVAPPGKNTHAQRALVIVPSAIDALQMDTRLVWTLSERC
jgi:hypothetical protein